MKIQHIFWMFALLMACGQETVEEKQARLEELRAQAIELNHEIRTLESEIEAANPQFSTSNGQFTLVSTMEVSPQPFEHKIEVRASVASRKNVQLSAEAMGRVERIYIREGDRVGKGQSLIALDASILENSIAELQTSLELATTVFQKRERLWRQNIGSEIQYLEAKNNMESLERKLATSYSQLRQHKLVAPFSGIVDEVQAKLGEMAQPGLPLVRILSTDEMHLKADVSEKYLGSLKPGDSVESYFPTFETELKSIVTSIGQVINEQNRTFSIEVALPSGKISYKPNLVAILTIRDYYQPESLAVPSELIQQDNRGNFVYVLENSEEELKARKIHVTPGKTFNSRTEVLQGIEPGMKLIAAGHREVTDGALVQIAERETL